MQTIQYRPIDVYGRDKSERLAPEMTLGLRTKPERPSFIAHSLASGAVIGSRIDPCEHISYSFINISTVIMASRPPDVGVYIPAAPVCLL